MSTRKYESGYSKLQKKRRVKALITSQKGVMNKFIKIDEKNELEIRDGCSLNEQDNNLDIGESNNREIVNDNVKEIGRLDNSTFESIYDPSQWKNIDTTLRDLLVENGLLKLLI